MPSKRGSLPILFLIPTLVGPLAEHAMAQPAGKPLLRPTDREGSVRVEPDRKVINRRNVTVDLTRLRARNNRRLTLPLFDGAPLVLVRDRTETPRRNALVWLGHVKDQPGSSVTLSLVDDVVIGNVMTRVEETSRFYQIRYLGGGVHTLLEIDQSGYGKDALLRDRGTDDEESTSSDEQAPKCVSDPASDIDVLVLYTKAALAGAGGPVGMEATIYLAIAETNLSYSNSAITQRLRLAHMEEVDYTEGTDVEVDRNHLKNPSDGVMDNALAVRNTYSADVAVLLVEYPKSYPYCGIAYIMYNVSNNQEKKAYAVVVRDCAIGIYAFAHELGHIMGARHDWHVDDTNNAPYVYNHAYVFKSRRRPARGWRTIMSYDNDCSESGIAGRDCPLLPYWSNPDVQYPPGDPMGVAAGEKRSDNHRTLETTASTVANFRCSSRGIGNVWMKDTWNDTGHEPDPLTVGQEMWASPYIWVRRSRDVTLTQQYQHQSPLAGAPNRVYVQLHNGGNATSGQLELYQASAPTSVAWPDAWTLVATIPVSSFLKNSVRVVEASWTPPAAGTYPLIARWVSATDPMASPESSDVERNVRWNNNIIWRNLIATAE